MLGWPLAVWHALHCVVKLPGRARLQLSGGGGPGGIVVPEPPAPVVTPPEPVDVVREDPPDPAPTSCPPGPAPGEAVAPMSPSEQPSTASNEEADIASPKWRRNTCNMQPSVRFSAL